MSELEMGRQRLERFASSVSQAATARSLDLLADIKSTIDSMELTTGVLRAFEAFALKACAKLAQAGCPLDPDGVLDAVLEKASSEVHGLYNSLIARRESARRDDRLKEEDGIEDAFTDAIAASADLHNVIEELRFLIAENDVDCEQHETDESKSFSDPAALRDYLLSL